jgi:hypothetical protein
MHRGNSRRGRDGLKIHVLRSAWAVLWRTLPRFDGHCAWQLAGQKGSVRIAHTGGWQGIKVKVASLEPTTGYSFDTVCEPRQHA